MAYEKQLNDGFSGLVPPTPRATRSARRRSVIRSKPIDNQMCAFDLLATVAGNFLVEGNNCNSSADMSNSKEQPTSLKDSVKKEEYGDDKPYDSRSCDQGICNQKSFDTELVSLTPVVNNCSKEHPLSQNDACSGYASVVTTSDCSVKVDSPVELVGDENKARLGSFTRITNPESSGLRVSSSCKLKVENKKHVKVEPFHNGKPSIGNMADMCSSDCHVAWGQNPSEAVSLDRSVKFPLSKGHIPCGSFSVNRDDVMLGTRDDDENSGCTQPSTFHEASRPLPCSDDRRIQKIVASDYRKVSSPTKDSEQFNAGQAYHNRESAFKRQRSLKDYPFKKRKLYDYCCVSNPDHGGDNGEGLCSPHGKGSCRDVLAPDETPEGVTGQLSSAAVECASFRSKDSQVKLKIKSFRVPELCIEIPETATVSSLKRTIKEAVTAILGSGLRVGVVLQGKKIRDDSKTLLQTGICQGNKSDGLGFTLEPDSSKAPPVFRSDRHSFVRNPDPPQPLTRYPTTYNSVHNVVQHRASDMLPDPPATNITNFIESDHDSAPSPPDTSHEKSAVDSRALVAVASMNAEALNVVPMRKPKKSESVQRRIRRPFSVSEVEALVQAVEKLGTGRWRDVKLQAFDTAKHRTYVDLKDKWKTLVHTARISPQQRRGEPVPQELLDRVLMAHDLWTQQQAKQQLKQHSEGCRL